MHKKALYQQLQEKNRRIELLEKQACTINESSENIEGNDNVKINQLSAQCALLSKENEELQIKIKDLKQSNQMYINDFNQSSETIKALEKNNAKANDANLQSIKSMEEVKRVYIEKYEKCEQDKKSLEEVKNLFIEKFTKSLDTIKELEKDKKELDLLKPNIRSLETSLEKEKEKIISLNEERNEYMKKFEASEKQIKLLEDQKKDLNERLDTLKIITDESILNLTEENTKLQENIVQAQLMLESKIQECQKKDSQLQKVQENKAKYQKMHLVINVYKKKLEESGKELKRKDNELAQQKEITNDVVLRNCDLERQLKGLKQDHQQVKTECTSWET